MKISNNGINLIKQFEGVRLKPYLDAVKVATIGYGSTFYENGKSVTLEDRAITKDRATEILEYQVQNVYGKAINRYVKVPITQNQFDALCSFAYNVGIGNLQKSTLLKKLNKGDFIGAGAEFLKWNKANGKILNGLTTRRQKEQALWLSNNTPVKDE